MGEANISWVTDNIATGGDLSYNPPKASVQVAELIDSDIDLIIDCRVEANDAAIWEQTDIEYVHLPTDDREDHHIPAELFDAAEEAAQPVLENDGKVLIHCHMGINRGPSVAYGVLLDQGYDDIEAFDLIREKRNVAAVLYAEDALEAHVMRNGGFEVQKRLDALRSHMEAIWTPQERGRIQRIIRSNHRQDDLEWNAYGRR